MKSLTVALSAALIIFAVSPAGATPIQGSKVTGSTVSVTGGPGFSSSDDFGTKVKIGAGTEFDATSVVVSGGKNANAWSYSDTYSANFNGNNSLLKVTDSCNALTGTNACHHDPYAPFEMTFTDKAFIGDILTLISGGTDYQWKLIGDTITINYLGGGGNPDLLKLSITSVTPEPSSIALLGSGLIALAFFGRRRLTA